MFLVETTVAGAVEFSAAAAAVTFAEELQIPTPGSDISARILGYSYASLGAAHTVRLWLATAPAVGANLRTILEEPAQTVNDFTYGCGPGGLIVPRVQASGATFQLFFETVNKADAGTLRVWYDIRKVGE